MYLWLHSWELVAMVLIAGAFFPAWAGMLVPLGFGMAVHMLFDACVNPIRVSHYSLAVRISYRFSGQRFYQR